VKGRETPLLPVKKLFTSMTGIKVENWPFLIVVKYMGVYPYESLSTLAQAEEWKKE
jgi:hypothetical protein